MRIRGRYGTGTMSRKIFSPRDSPPRLCPRFPRPANLSPRFFNFESRFRIPDFLIFASLVPGFSQDPENPEKVRCGAMRSNSGFWLNFKRKENRRKVGWKNFLGFVNENIWGLGLFWGCKIMKKFRGLIRKSLWGHAHDFDLYKFRWDS